MVNTKVNKGKPTSPGSTVSRSSKFKVGKMVGADKQSEAFAKSRLEMMSMIRSSLVAK
jgi:hypothetical protein